MELFFKYENLWKKFTGNEFKRVKSQILSFFELNQINNFFIFDLKTKLHHTPVIDSNLTLIYANFFRKFVLTKKKNILILVGWKLTKISRL